MTSKDSIDFAFKDKDSQNKVLKLLELMYAINLFTPQH